MTSSTSPPSTDTDHIIFEFPGAIRLYQSGRVERPFPDELLPPSLDPSTGVQSKDITINPNTGLSARLYLPPQTPPNKIPIVVSIHGGGFCLMHSSSSTYHNYINSITANARVLSVSIDYRLAPEHPLPAAYDDCWDVLQWVLAASDAWLSEFGDLDRVFLSGESSGGNIVHNLGMRLGTEGKKVEGLVMLLPYFWGEERIGNEGVENGKNRILKVENIEPLWRIVCPETVGLDDPRINPVAVDAPSLALLGCRRVFVAVAELDLLRDRGRVYYEKLKESGWEGEAEFLELEDEDHGFKPGSLKEKELMERIVSFVNKA